MTVAKKQVSGPASELTADLRGTLEWLKAEGDLIESDEEVDPDLEIIALQKHMDGGCPALFNNIKGRPNHRVVTNLFSDINVINKMFGWKDDQDRTVRLAHALTHPLPPIEISQDEAPCQAVVIENPKDVNELIVPARHTEFEPELTVGSGIRCVTGEYFGGGTDLGYNRMNFRWGNVGTFQISPGSHMWQVVSKHYEDDEPVPITMCFGVPPACTLLAGGAFDYVILPQGCDEIGIAGAVQGPADPPRQGVHRRRDGDRRLRDRARGLRQPARPTLRNRRGRGGGRPGKASISTRSGPAIWASPTRLRRSTSLR